jgi:hypothetical protein
MEIWRNKTGLSVRSMEPTPADRPVERHQQARQRRLLPWLPLL